MEFSIFIFFFISVFLFGSFLVGPVSLRVFSTVIMIILLVANYNKIRRMKLSNRYIQLYCLFLLFMSTAMIYNGEYEEFELVKNLLAFHLVCIVSYYATRYYVANTKALNYVSLVIIWIVFLNAVVTIMQYFSMPEGWTINLTLTGNRNEMIVDYSDTLYEGEALLGTAKTPGLFDSVVVNSMFISTFGLVPFVLLSKHSSNSSYIKNLSYWGCLVLSVTACYMCQERSAIIMYLLAIIYLFWKQFEKGSIIGAITLIAFLVLGMNYFNNVDDIGRFSDFSVANDVRTSIWEKAGTFISENLLWGGPLKFLRMADHMPHNFFFNAFIYGGLLGGMVVILLFFMIIIKAIKTVVANHNSSGRVFGVALISYLLQGMFHNASLVTGSATIFVLLALIESSVLMGHQSRITNKNF